MLGVTNNLNSLADGVRCPLDFEPGPERRPLLHLVDPAGATPEVRAMANDPAFACDLWAGVRAAFEPGALDRLTKELIALAASVTAKSDYGVDFHLHQVRRLGLSEAGMLEALQVTQMFNGFTKIADALRLSPDDFGRVLRKS